MTQFIEENKTYGINNNLLQAPLDYDIRHPLHSLNAISNQLSGDFYKKNKYGIAVGIEEINKNIGILNQFIDRLIINSFKYEQSLKIVDSSFSITKLFEDIISLYSGAIKKKGNIYSIEQSDIKIFADRDLMSAILRNLIDNANKNTVGGEIKISAIENDTHILITVADTGNGMDSAFANSLTFENISNNSNQIGYQIIYYILQKMNGYLNIKSALGIGTVIIITLPKAMSKN